MFGTDLAGLAADLTAQLQLPVEIDPRDLVLPGILLIPGVIEFDRLDPSTFSCDLELWLVAGDTNPVTALDELTTMLMKLRENGDGAPSEAEPITVQLSAQSADPLPALRCPYPVTLTFTQETEENDHPEN